MISPRCFPLLKQFKQIATIALAFMAMLGMARSEEGSWKTAFVKRGFVGNYRSASVGGTNSTMRMRTPLAYDGTKVRVYLRGCRLEEVLLTKMALVKGADDHGENHRPSFPDSLWGRGKLEA